MSENTTTISRPQRNGPKYEQLKDRLVAMIREGRFGPGQILPSENQLALDMKIARNTVRQALGELEHQGVVRKVHGKGTFVSDKALKQLRKGFDVYALMVPDVVTGHYPTLQKGFGHAASQLYHQILVCDSGNDVHKQADVIIQLVEKKVSGVAMVPVTQTQTPVHQIRLLQSNHIPVVFCHRRPSGVYGPLLGIPFKQAGFLAGSTLLEHGHQLVAFICPHSRPVGEGYEFGLRDALEQGGCSLPDNMVCYGEFTDKYSSERFMQTMLDDLLDRPAGKRPTAIFTTYDAEAERLYLMLSRMGISVPDDLSLISFGDKWRKGAFAEALTSVVIDEVQIGMQAATLLNDISEGRRSFDSNESFLASVELYPGRTIRTLPNV